MLKSLFLLGFIGVLQRAREVILNFVVMNLLKANPNHTN